ncbi:putative aldouronate transport system substrate-binding protein [Paenibacillus sp. UNCCL117]|uniref:ABC transporter substrate-binding protein n=1 Tax=unclassified Paenibacillus TaxID=185978 RepID=UPI000883DFFB|nr:MULTISPECIES: ABC transporter substrate-binding protein [unclassified Paenibacillus]SDC18534.1 putative aldouronate transport system substrate-binding protein [Paenibacillus sp. cl123]SFW18219.1 putative aldouronate transport system substrate-binding protein [Paenibacillus sp. UNCCL117]
MKKRFMAAVALTTSLALLSACGADTEADRKEAASKAEASSDDQVTGPGEFPITKEKTTLKVMVKGSSVVENFATNEFTKWLEEKTNIHIEWEVAPEKTFAEKLNVSLASGDYPDVLLSMSVSPIQQSIYGKDGVFIPLNSYIDKYGVEMKKMFGQISYVKDLITLPDGKIYSVPQVNDCYHCSLGQKMWIYQPWLDKLGLKMPTTTEEFYQVLKAFKEKDPNGNGKADEIALVGATNGPSSTLDLFLTSAFIEKDFNLKYVKDGKVQVAYNQPEWKEALKYISKLYAEGLVSPQTFTQDRAKLKQMGLNPEIPIVGAIASQNQTVFSDVDNPRFKDFVAVPPLQGPGGVRSTAYNPYAVSTGQFVITNKAKNPAAAFRLADLLLSQEATLRSTQGRPGQEWDWAAPGEIGVNGKPAVWKTIAPNGKLQNVHWAQAGPSLRTNDLRLSVAADPKNSLELILFNETKKYEPYKLAMDKIVPPVFFTNEQAEELSNLEKSLTDYRTEFFAKTVTGSLDVEKEWNNYLNTLEKMNIKRYLEIYQDAYKQYHAKK